jgi:tetratricopeptide (TPR) repeat protein
VSVVESRELYETARLAFDLGYQEFGTTLLEQILKHLPNHVAARCLLGEKLVALERLAEAQEHFESVLGVYPIDLTALREMGNIALAKGSTGAESEHLRRAWELYPYDATTRELVQETLGEVSRLSLARILTLFSLHEEALPYYEAALDQALDRPSEQPIAVLLLTEALWKTGRMERARSLLETLISQQPMWIRPKLILADMALGAGEDALGVALLHDASALDSSLLVTQELFGQDERYDSLLRDSLEVPSPGSELVDSLPRVLRYLLRAEPLPDPLTMEKEALDESALARAPDRMAQKGGSVVEMDEGLGEIAYLSLASERLDDDTSISDPQQEVLVRLILSSRDRLAAKYGDHGYRELDAKLSELREVTAQATGHEVIKIYVDDKACLDAYGVNTVDPSDPHEVRRLIEHLEAELRHRFRKVRSLLIIGGDSVIPFHRLVNPADDEDGEILSDWPYAARDGSSLLARFSVGRMPDRQEADPEALLHFVENAIQHHSTKGGDSSVATTSAWPRRILKLFGSKKEAVSSIGYSAEIWAEASRSVFQVVGDASTLMLSPPLTDYDFLTSYEKVPTLGYFNLHGFQGSPYWYGHGESEHGSQLVPVALTPLSISWTDAQAALIYTEACYGADLRDQYADGSIAWNFLANGALGFVGFTAMSYGSLAPPLSGADLVGRHFLEGIVEGLPIGFALREARSAFIRAAATEQGYLDGEDQKTLLSLMLYGDPSISLARRPALQEVDAELEVSCPPLACHWRMVESESLSLSADLRQKVQRSVPFLPASDLEAHPLILCSGACSAERCGVHRSSPASCTTDSSPKLIVTSQPRAVSKGGNHVHHVVKVTVNGRGNVTKVLMSRGGKCVNEGSVRR